MFKEVGLLDPLIADDLFHKSVTLDTEHGIENYNVPILGKRVFGAPVSFLKADSDQRIRAEAHVARYRWLREIIRKKPKVYVQLPSGIDDESSSRVSEGVSRLKAVANACDVELAFSDSMSELANILIEDEAA